LRFNWAIQILLSGVCAAVGSLSRIGVLDNGFAIPDGNIQFHTQEVTIRQHVVLWGALGLVLAGCGSSEPGRTSGGMATGAGTGALIGLIGGPIGVVVGAAVGAGAGALTATNTAPSAVNLGDPLWAHSPGAAGPPGGGPVQPSQADGGMPPPRPLESASSYAPPPAQPSPGASPVPLSSPIESQPLPPAQ
jgi:hypothetical protein